MFIGLIIDCNNRVGEVLAPDMKGFQVEEFFHELPIKLFSGDHIEVWVFPGLDEYGQPRVETKLFLSCLTFDLLTQWMFHEAVSWKPNPKLQADGKLP